MPYVQQISDQNGVNPNELAQGMAQNIAYFRQARDRRTNTINELNQQLANSGLSDKVQMTVDEDGRISSKLSPGVAQANGITDPNQSQLAANSLIYGSGGNDLTLSGTGKNVQAQNLLNDKSYDTMQSALAQTLQNGGDPQAKAAFHQAAIASQRVSQNIPVTPASVGKSVQDVTPQTPPMPTPEAMASGAAIVNEGTQLTPAATPATPATAATAPTVPPTPAATAPATAPDSTPATTPVTNQQAATPPAATAPQQKESQSKRMKVDQKGAVKEAGSQRLETSVENAGGNIKGSVAAGMTQTSYSGSMTDELQQSLRGLGRQRSLAGIIHNTLGGNQGQGAAEAQFAADYAERAAQIAEHDKQLNESGTQQAIAYKDAEIKKDSDKIQVASGANMSNAVNIQSNITGASATGQKNDPNAVGSTNGTIPAQKGLNGGPDEPAVDAKNAIFDNKAHTVNLNGTIMGSQQFNALKSIMPTLKQVSKTYDTSTGTYTYTYKAASGEHMQVVRSADGNRYQVVNSKLLSGTWSDYTGGNTSSGSTGTVQEATATEQAKVNVADKKASVAEKNASTVNGLQKAAANILNKELSNK